jgi:hypothetical protein
MLHAHVTPQCGEDGRMAGVTYLLQQGFETRAPTDREHLRVRLGVARALTARSQRAGRFSFPDPARRGRLGPWITDALELHDHGVIVLSSAPMSQVPVRVARSPSVDSAKSGSADRLAP